MTSHCMVHGLSPARPPNTIYMAIFSHSGDITYIYTEDDWCEKNERHFYLSCITRGKWLAGALLARGVWVQLRINDLGLYKDYWHLFCQIHMSMNVTSERSWIGIRSCIIKYTNALSKHSPVYAAPSYNISHRTILSFCCLLCCPSLQESPYYTIETKLWTSLLLGLLNDIQHSFIHSHSIHFIRRLLHVTTGYTKLWKASSDVWFQST